MVLEVVLLRGVVVAGVVGERGVGPGGVATWLKRRSWRAGLGILIGMAVELDR